VFFVGHLAEQCQREILPFGSLNEHAFQDGEQGQRLLSNCLDSNYHKGADGKRTMISELNQIGHLASNAEAHRVYDGKGLARTIKNGGGMGAKTGLYALNDERQGNRIYDGDGCRATITCNKTGGNKLDKYKVGQRIRRLTPNECELLQGFEKDFTKYGTDEKGNVFEVSDSQRYKVLGNAVTVNVIEAIVNRMMPCLENY
jgi:DNA (cytosine-5)-methyltransferase 1